MKIDDFKLERYFAKYEFSTKYLLSSSDCDGYGLDYVLNSANKFEMELWNNLKLGYTDSQGSLFLRTAIAKQYSTIVEDDILVMSPGEANFILMNVLLKPGDDVVCMAPAYQSLYQVAKSLGCSINFWQPDNDNWQYNADDLEKLIKPNTKLIIVNFPHNPTGFLPSNEEVLKIVEIARKNDIVLFSDEMYHQLVHNQEDNIPAFCDLYENAISLWGMAKSFGLAGLRLGWIATKNHKLISEIISFKDYLTICNNAVGEVLSTIALNHKEKFINPNLKKIVKNIDLFSDFQKQHQNLLDFRIPKSGSTAFVKLKTNLTSLEYCGKLVQETGIMLVPAEMFDFGHSHIRIGFGRENFAEILGVWGNYLKNTK
jgi:aspartate/methionine/tyrosine aminotransferase